MTDDQFERIKKGLNFHSEGGVYNLCTLTETALRAILDDATKEFEAQIENGRDLPAVAYMQGAEKQIQIDAEQIRALQKQNGELTDELTKKSDTNHQLVEQLAKLNERCSELEEENAELKEKWLQATDEGTSWAHRKSLERENLELKELIKNIIRVTWGEGWNYSLDWKVKAEQFLNEVKK